MRPVTPKSTIRWAIAAIALLAAGCGGALPQYHYDGEPDPRKSEWILGVGDVIAINVWENANLNTESAIRPDGTITMPLVGDIRAVGETPTTLKAKIKTLLQTYLKPLQGTEITVAVKAAKSYRFTVQGEVGKMGVITSDQFVTIAEALALAGGPSRFAKRNGITITRRDPKTGKTREIPIDYDLVASGKRPDMNIWVLPGDSIWVP